MDKFIKGISYSFNRNIGWQDRTIRTLIGISAIIGSLYFLKSNTTYSILLGVLAIAQLGTVFSARCIICYFTGLCTITVSEKNKLNKKEINYDN